MNKILAQIKPFCFSFVVSLLLFATLLGGWKMTKFKIPGTFSLDEPISFLVRVAFLLLVFFILAAISFLFLVKGDRLLSRLTKFKPFPRFTIEFDLRGILLCGIAIAICWIPWIVFSYPGNMNFDTVNQLWQYSTDAPVYYSYSYVDAKYVDHHPVFDTLIFGMFLDLGNILGSQNMGVFVFVIIQTLLSIVSLSLACCYLSRLKVPKIMRIIAVLFAALFPPFAQFSGAMLKDSLFSPLFLLYFICCIEIFLTKGSVVKVPKFLICFLTVSLFCILTKKTGLYVIAFTGIVFLVAYRNLWKHILLSVLLPVILCSWLIPTLVYPVLNVAPGGKQETLGTLFQQTALYVIEHPDDVTDEEYEVIARVLEPDRFEEEFDKTIIDPVKNTFYLDSKTDDIVDYVLIWFKQGLRHPATYLKATLQVNARLISPVQEISYYGDTITQEQYDFHERYEGEADILIYKPDPIRDLSDKARSAYLDTVKSSHILTALFSRGLWGFWIPTACLFFAFFYQKKYLVIFVPVIISLLFLFISPTSSSRYILPLLYIDISLIGLVVHSCLSIDKTESEGQNVSNARP